MAGAAALAGLRWGWRVRFRPACGRGGAVEHPGFGWGSALRL